MFDVTIIIPYKNTAVYLRKLLDSIFVHVIPFSLQVIVINDKSDKNLQEYDRIISQFKDRVEFYNNDTGVNNAGAARNIGLKYAKGKWILFSDADDCFLEGWGQAVEKYLNSDFDVIYFPFDSRNDNGSPCKRGLKYMNVVNEYLQNPNLKSENRLKFLFTAVWSKLIRFNVIRKNNVKFDEVMHINDQMFTSYLAFKTNKITVSDEMIYCLYFHEGTLTTIHSIDAVYQRWQVYCRRYNYLKSILSPNEFKQLGLNKIEREKMENVFIRVIKGEYSFKDYIKLKKLYRTNHLPYLINPVVFLLKIIKQIITKINANRY